MEQDLNASVAVWAAIFSRLAAMMSFGALAIAYILVLRRYTGKRQPRGVVVFGILLILGSIYKLWGFFDYEYYRFMFRQLPDHVILIRYLGSILLRIIGLGIATGLLMLNERARKAFIILALVTLCTLYFKHPFYVFENISRLTEQTLFHKEVVTELAYPMYPWVSLIFIYLVDIIFYGSALFYFTRAKVKEQFC